MNGFEKFWDKRRQSISPVSDVAGKKKLAEEAWATAKKDACAAIRGEEIDKTRNWGSCLGCGDDLCEDCAGAWSEDGECEKCATVWETKG